MSDANLAKLINAVQNSAKYQHIIPQLIKRIAQAELAKGRKYKEALKATKNKLHQVGAAYQPGKMHYAAWLEQLKAAENEVALKEVCLSIMSAHASTNERLLLLDTFYTEIFANLPPVNSILDIACGLNPLTLPWMPIASGTKYYACDIYTDMLEFLNAAFPVFDIAGEAFPCDAAASPPDIGVDLAFVLKTIPCLEQVDRSAGERLLDGLNAKHIVVSFPTKSLGGRGKGMVENYTTHMEQLTVGKGWQMKRLNIVGELVFLVEK